ANQNAVFLVERSSPNHSMLEPLDGLLESGFEDRVGTSVRKQSSQPVGTANFHVIHQDSVSGCEYDSARPKDSGQFQKRKSGIEAPICIETRQRIIHIRVTCRR